MPTDRAPDLKWLTEGLLPCVDRDGIPCENLPASEWCAACKVRPYVYAALRAERERVQDGEARELLRRMLDTEWCGHNPHDGNPDHYYCPGCRGHGPEEPIHEPGCPYLDAREYLSRPAPEPSPEPAAEGAREVMLKVARVALLGGSHAEAIAALESYAAERERRVHERWARALGIAPEDTWWSRALADPETAAEYVAERRRVAVGEALEEAVALIPGEDCTENGKLRDRIRALKERER